MTLKCLRGAITLLFLGDTLVSFYRFTVRTTSTTRVVDVSLKDGQTQRLHQEQVKSRMVESQVGASENKDTEDVDKINTPSQLQANSTRPHRINLIQPLIRKTADTTTATGCGSVSMKVDMF